MYYYGYNTKIGKIYISADENSVLAISLNKPDYCEKETPLIKKAFQELDEYFSGKRKTFDLPLKLNGTEFQQKIWKELIKIPYGKTISYKELAKRAGNEKACRAAGMANNKNKIMIVIPCHRVVGSNGDLTGYAGGLKVKKQLLDLEAENSQN